MSSTGLSAPEAAQSFVQSSASAAGSCRAVEAPTSSVPMNANATPTEQMMRYFHIASSEAGERCRQMRNAVTSVVASMPTHMMPRLFEISTSVMAASAPNHSAPKRRASRGVNAPASASRRK